MENLNVILNNGHTIQKEMSMKNSQSETVAEMDLMNIRRSVHIIFSEQMFSSMNKQVSGKDHIIWLKIILNMQKMLKSYKIFSYDKQENIRKK